MNNWQRRRFADKIIAELFNTVVDKRIAMFGFAFKKNTADTRESSAIYVASHLLDDNAKLSIYDPKVPASQVMSELKNVSNVDDRIDRLVTICNDPYEAAHDSHAIVVMTEWDEFKDLDYTRLYRSMKKPASLFDGRVMLDHEHLQKIGFRVHSIGVKCSRSVKATQRPPSNYD